MNQITLRNSAAGFLFFLSLAAHAAPVQASIEADLVVGYAPSYANSVGGDDNVEVIVANAVVGNNRINEISGTGATMRIVGFIRSSQETQNQTTTGGIVGWLANRDARLADVVDFGAAKGADLVTYIVTNSDSGSIAAVAQQPGMYSAYNPSAVWSAVFAHETGGHNYGRSHSDGVLSPKTVMLHNYCGGGSTPPYYFSNPNIVFNGVLLRGTGDNCGQGSLINGGDNSSASALAVADRRARVLASPKLDRVVRRWVFTNAAAAAPAGTTVVDQITGAPAIVRGAGATFTGQALRIPGGSSGNVAANSIAAYIDLPNGLLSSHQSLTIEIWATPLTVANFGRLLDFGRPVQGGDGLGAPGEYTGAPGTAAPGATQASDGIMLSTSIGTDLSAQRFEALLNGTAVTLDSGLVTLAGVQHHYAITFNSGEGAHSATGGRWRWFRNGDQVAYLDVPYQLSSLEDVNNWLGRSLWSGDAMARADYAEVRISDLALSREEIVANYRLGPAYAETTTAFLTASDGSGASSFNASGVWSGAAAPANGSSYETFSQTLRTPTTGAAHTFAGSSLRVSGGRLLYAGLSGGTITLGDLTLNGGFVANGGGGAYTLAGAVSATAAGGVFHNINNSLTLTAALTGSGPITHLGNTTVLTGNNAAFTGRTYVGNGFPGALTIDSQARLGPAPATFAADRLVLNRGTLNTTATFALDQATRGILLNVSGGVFNVGSGTTLTVSSPISTPAPTGNAYTGSLTKAGSGTLVLAGANPSFQGMVYTDTSATSGSSGVLRIAHPQALVNARSPIFIRNNNSGASTLQFDGTAGNITQTQRLWLSGRTSGLVSVQNTAGVNAVGGVTADVGGSFYVLQADAGTLRITGNLTSQATGTRTFTLQGAGDIELAGGTANGSATVGLNKTGNGTLIVSSTLAHTGTTSLTAGTLRLTSAGNLSAGTLTGSLGSTLSGVGSIAAPATLSGNHRPGLPAGTQTFSGALTYGATSRLRWTLQADTTSTASTGRVSAAAVTVGSGVPVDLKFDEAGSTTNFSSAFWTLPRTWSAISATTRTGTFILGTVSPDAGGRLHSAYGTFDLDQTAPSVVVRWTPKPFAAWRGTLFGVRAGDATLTAFGADPDSDGIVNGLEYVLGLNPEGPGDSPAITRSTEGRAKLVFSRRASASDVTLLIEGADSPAGPWSGLARSTAGAAMELLAAGVVLSETPSGDFLAVEVTDNADPGPGRPSRFLRLIVTEL